MSRNWKGSQVHCTTHSSLWTDFDMIMVDGVAELSSGSVELDFVNATSNPVVIKPGKIVATAVEIESVEMLPDIEQDDDKSAISCVENTNNFMYPYIISDEMMDAEEKEFDLDMDIIEVPLSQPKVIPREKGTWIDCVEELY